MESLQENFNSKTIALRATVKLSIAIALHRYHVDKILWYLQFSGNKLFQIYIIIYYVGELFLKKEKTSQKIDARGKMQEERNQKKE